MESIQMKITKENIAIIEGDECISKWVESEGRLDHDPNSLPIMLSHVKENDTVIDIGAFIGDHTIAYAKKVGLEGKVIAFEPNQSSFECLEYNMKGFDNVELRKEGVSDSLHNISLTDVPTNAGMAYAEKSKKGIKCVSIDSLNLEKLDFIKIDAEGYEHNILNGAIETIKRLKPIMVIEINNAALLRNGTSNNDIYIFLNDLGYDYKNIYEGQTLYEEQLDLICIPKK
jgi:FkbM family methyltransferase